MTHVEIVERLVGPIRPVCSSEIDAERFENLKTLCELTNELIARIDAVGYDFREHHQASAYRASEYATNFLTNTVGISNK